MFHGKPNWFELTTADGALDAAGAFYGAVFGWQIADAGMAGFRDHLARRGNDMIAGLMGPAHAPDGADGADGAGDHRPPQMPRWQIYLDVDDADAAAQKAADLGGQVMHPPTDIPGTGRFAVLADPQGASFAIVGPLNEAP